LRIGVPANFFFDGAASEVRAAFDAAMQVLESRGARTVRLEIPHNGRRPRFYRPRVTVA